MASAWISANEGFAVVASRESPDSVDATVCRGWEGSNSPMQVIEKRHRLPTQSACFMHATRVRFVSPVPDWYRLKVLVVADAVVEMIGL